MPERKPGAALQFVDGAYRSAPVEPSLLARRLPGASFYTRAVRIVWSAARAARRGAYGDAQWNQSSLGILRALEDVGVQVEITGTERFRGLDGPCVFVGNHMSTLETFVLPTVIQPLKRVTFIVKRSLLEYPVFGHVMRSRDPIVVGRTNPREDLKAVLEGGVERLRAGISIIVFPQTTRTLTFDPAAFNTIGVKLARRGQVPVVPLAIKSDAWGNGRWIKDFGRIDPALAVHFAFGEPLAVPGSGAAEHRQVSEFIRRNLRAWGGKVAADPPPAQS